MTRPPRFHGPSFDVDRLLARPEGKRLHERLTEHYSRANVPEPEARARARADIERVAAGVFDDFARHYSGHKKAALEKLLKLQKEALDFYDHVLAGAGDVDVGRLETILRDMDHNFRELTRKADDLAKDMPPVTRTDVAEPTAKPAVVEPGGGATEIETASRRVRPRTGTSPPGAPARRAHTLDSHQQSVLDEIADDLEANNLTWEDLGVRKGDGVDGFLARYDDPYDGILELDRRLDNRLELDPRARMEMDVEGLPQQPRPGGITRGTPEARARVRESSLVGDVAEARQAGELTPGGLPRTAREVFPGRGYDELVDALQRGRISMREFAGRFPPDGARQVDIPVPDDLRGRVTTRRVDHMRMEGDNVVLRESKDVTELDIDSSQRLKEQIDRDLWIARRYSGVVIEWRIDGALTPRAKATFKLLMEENPGIFRVNPPGILD